MSDIDVGIRDDPDVNPSSLRFGVGNLVIYKHDHRRGWPSCQPGWHEGEVVKVAQRAYFGNPHSEFIHYIVWPNTDDVDGTVWVQGDTEDYIRPRLEDLTPDPAKFKPFFSHPEDPLSYLYTGLTHDPYTEDGDDMAEQFRRMNMVDDARINPDGSIRLNMGGRTMSTATIPMPEETAGVPGHAIFQVSLSVQLRRDIHSKAGSGGVLDIVGNFMSIVPSESSLDELEQASRTSSDKMLQLADALMSGVHGWPRDPNRACQCYEAAGMGCLEEDLDETTGILVGNPEAMVANAYIVITYVKQQKMGHDLTDNISYARILQFCLGVPGGMKFIHRMLWWTSNSVNRGWISPFALELARSIKEVDLQNNHQVDEETKELIEPLFRALEYRELEIEIEKLQEQGLIPRGNPSDATIQLFRAKADEIFRSLPITTESIHIEYRQVPRAPFPTVVFALLPSMERVVKTLRLPDGMSLSPFSQESFEFVWLRVAFELHLGDLQSRQRTRPSVFTVHDSHGNREFASYLKGMLRGSGTQVRLISHGDPVQLSSGRQRRSKSLGEIVRKVETCLLEIPGLLFDQEAVTADVVSEAQRDFVQRSAQTLLVSVGDDRDEIVRKATQLKTEGNDLFVSMDYTAAVKCYSIAIQLMSHLIDPDRSSNKLIGTLLSNRAACYLELEERGASPEFRRLLAQNAIKDCTLALESSWATDALPRSIMDKLKFRRDKATARHDALSTDFESVAPILFPDSETNGRRRRRRQRRSRRRSSGDEGSNLESIHDSIDGTYVESAGQNESNEQRHLDSGVPTTEPDESNLQQDSAGDTTMVYGKILHEHSLAKNSDDGCPICLRDFSGELSHTYSAVLPCGEHAICIECVCRLKKQEDKEKTAMLCPLCRSLVDPEFVEDLAEVVMDVAQELAMLIVKLPVGDMEDRVEVGRRLLWKNDFCVEKVIEALECVFDAQSSQSLFRTSVDLTHQEKESIYGRARYPVNQLQEQLQRLLDEQRTTFETSRVNRLLSEIRQVRKSLAASRRQAREEIYTQLNSVGNMGAQLGASDESGIIQIDFHGLHVNEMYQKFAEQVKPILPVVGKVMVITGRGLHSANGESKLKKSLMKRIEQHEPDIRWERVAENPGALNAVWTPASST